MGLEPATTGITIWDSTIELRPPVNRKMLLCNLLEAECRSLFQIVLPPGIPLYPQKTGTSVSSDGTNSNKPHPMQQANSKRKRRAFQLQALNSSIMDFGMENFWANEEYLRGYSFLQCVFCIDISYHLYK